MEVPPMIDLETAPVQGQLASAALDLNGRVVRGQLGPEEASLIYRMMLELGTLNESSFQRMTVTMQNVRYIVARDETHIYIVKTREIG